MINSKWADAMSKRHLELPKVTKRCEPMRKLKTNNKTADKISPDFLFVTALTFEKKDIQHLLFFRSFLKTTDLM